MPQISSKYIAVHLAETAGGKALTDVPDQTEKPWTPGANLSATRMFTVCSVYASPVESLCGATLSAAAYAH